MNFKQFMACVLVTTANVAATNTYAQSAGPSSSPTPPGRSAVKPVPPSVEGASPGASSVRPSDKTLRRLVKTALKRTHGLNSSAIVVRARGGVVTLQGTVPDQKSVDVAVSTARSVPGVSSVINTLSVNRPTDSWR